MKVRTTMVGLLVLVSAGCGGSGSAAPPTPLEAAGGRTPAQPAEVQSAPPESAEGDGGVPFNLSTHCGIGVTTFRGRLWDPLSVEPGPSQPADPVEPGTMHLEEPDHAVFLGESGLRVDFRPAAADTPEPRCS